MSSKFLKHGYGLSIVLDISSESIGGSLVVLNQDQTSLVLHSTRLAIIWEKPVTPEPLLIRIRQTLLAVVKQLHNEGLPEVSRHGIYTHHIAKVSVTFASPWYLSQTEGLTVNYEKPTLITRAVLKKIIDQEERKFNDKLKEHTHSQLYNQAQIIERRIVDIKLNGYSTNSPYQKKAQKIDLSMHTSFVSQDILLVVNNSIGQYFNYRSIKYSSFPLVSFTALTHHTDLHDSIILDIRGETTDISLIKQGALWESVSFPAGTGGLLRAISEKTNTRSYFVS